jgi:hypothetical protein
MPRIRTLSRTNGVKRVPHLYSIVPAMVSYQLKQVVTKPQKNVGSTDTKLGQKAYVHRNTRMEKPKQKPTKNRSKPDVVVWPRHSPKK